MGYGSIRIARPLLASDLEIIRTYPNNVHITAPCGEKFTIEPKEAAAIASRIQQIVDDIEYERGLVEEQKRREATARREADWAQIFSDARLKSESPPEMTLLGSLPIELL